MNMVKTITVNLPKSKRTLQQQLKSAQNVLSTCRWRIRNATYHCINGEMKPIRFNEWKRVDYERMEMLYFDVIRAKMRIELIQNAIWGEHKNEK